jgi:CheY-like chemotaxis protein
MSAKGTILVVDNESDQLDMMKKILGRMGYEARITDNPGQALKMVAEQAFQLIIIDLIMPENRWYGAVRADKAGPAVRLCLCFFRPCAPLSCRAVGTGRV